MKHKIEIKDNCDDSYNITLDGSHITYVSHDDHGWAGIEAVIHTVKAFASELGIDVVETAA